MSTQTPYTPFEVFRHDMSENIPLLLGVPTFFQGKSPLRILRQVFEPNFRAAERRSISSASDLGATGGESFVSSVLKNLEHLV